MNYGEAQLAGYTVTEEEYKAIESLIADEYLAAYKEIDARLAQLYAQYADAKTSDDIYNWLIQYDRYNKLHADVAALYTQHSKAAGKLIEDAGLKGYIHGGAMISDKHANFIINNGTATYEDIIMLIDYIKERIKVIYDIDLILEQEIIR